MTTERPQKNGASVQAWLMVGAALLGMLLTQFIQPQAAALERHIVKCEAADADLNAKWSANRERIVACEQRINELERQVRELERAGRRSPR